MKFIFCSLICVIFCTALPAQDNKRELALISAHPVGEKKEINILNTTTPIQTKHRNVLARYNPFSLTAAGLMLLYQHVVSPQVSSSCIYTRSCSNFAKEAIKEYGLIKGVFLAADRLMRCNRSCENDHPYYSFNADGKITDEPVIYRKK
jgi:putative membrane protein insertion efficiency factor